MITYRPPDNSLYQFFSVPMSQPFNPEKVAELLVAGLATINLTIPPVGYLGTAPEDGELGISLPKTMTQQEFDSALAVLTAVANDPTRNDLVEEQEERESLPAKLANAKADVLALADDTSWDAMTNAQKIDNLRAILLHTTRSARYLLREKKKDLTGVFSITSKE